MNKQNKKLKRQRRVRTKVKSMKDMPRLSVFRSNHFIYAQLIDDTVGKTLFGVTERLLKDVKATKVERAKQVGQSIAKAAQEKNISKVVFDRGSYRYHGRVKALAEGAREGGLEF